MGHIGGGGLVLTCINYFKISKLIIFFPTQCVSWRNERTHGRSISTHYLYVLVHVYAYVQLIQTHSRCLSLLYALNMFVQLNFIYLDIGSKHTSHILFWVILHFMSTSIPIIHKYISDKCILMVCLKGLARTRGLNRLIMKFI